MSKLRDILNVNNDINTITCEFFDTSFYVTEEDEEIEERGELKCRNMKE